MQRLSGKRYRQSVLIYNIKGSTWFRRLFTRHLPKIIKSPSQRFRENNKISDSQFSEIHKTADSMFH